MSIQDWLRLVTLATIWGSSFLFTELALVDLGPLTVVNLRLLLAALSLLLVWQWRRLPWRIDRRLWRALLLMAIVNNILPFTLIVWAQTHISASLASILNASVPLFGVVLAWFFARDEQPSLIKFIGVAIGFIGVIVLIAPDGESLEAATLGGKIAVLTATFCYAASIIYGKRFKRWQVPTLVPAALQATIGALLLLPITLALETPWNYQISTIWTPIATICLGVFCSAIAYLLFFRILASAGAVNLMLVTLLIPISGCLLGAIFLQESLTRANLVGMLIIFTGLIIIDARLPQLLLSKLAQRRA